MSRNVVLIVALLLLLSINIPSNAVAMPTNPLTILPKDCRILAGKELPLTLEGAIPPNTSVTWEASSGGVMSVLPGWNAVLVAPLETTVVTISASISPTIPGMDSLITRQCIVTSPHSAPDGVAQTGEASIS